MKKKLVDNPVNKTWAKEARRILTANTPDIHTILTELSHLRVNSYASEPNQRRAVKITSAHAAIVESLKYGWTFGALGKPPPIKIRCIHRNRMVRAACQLAYRSGIRIGEARAREVLEAKHANKKIDQTPQLAQADHQ